MAQPEIVIHLSAQPLVKDSYYAPRHTYEINVMGTVNILECVRKNNCVKWHIEEAIEKTVEWTKVYVKGENVSEIMEKQINEFLNR